MKWDTLIRGALVFDGMGEAPRHIDVALKGDRIAAAGPDLAPGNARETVDAAGRWLSPGFWDIHTHLDPEVELDPGLNEVVRHGTTTAVVANCSIGVPFGRQNEGGHDPVVSCFARVENVPKPVLKRVADKITWDNPKSYLKHFASVPMGPNIVPMIPHSMLRIEAMGIDRALGERPTETELCEMERILEEAMRDGYAGFSTDALPFHYMSDDPHRKRRLPGDYASYHELKRLTAIPRRYGRVWQATPDKLNPLQLFRVFALTSGRFFWKPLKLTAVAALDVVTNRLLRRGVFAMTRLFNSWLMKGVFRFQALAAPFRIYSDGMITPLAEEVAAFRELVEIDLEDHNARRELLSDPAYVKRFRHAWYHDKRGFSLARIKRLIGIMDDQMSRDLCDMVMTDRPLAVWKDENLQQIYDRLVAWQATGGGARTEEEREVFASFDNPVGDDCEFFLHLLRRFDMQLRWYLIVANDRPARLEELIFDSRILLGFSDAGAHLSNMAYFDANLRGLQMAQRHSIDLVAKHIARLTQVHAEFWGIEDVGALVVGKRADLVLLDPDALAAYDSEASTVLEHRDVLGVEQMLNRSDGIVTDVWIAGARARQGSEATRALGREPMGTVLTVRS